LKDAFNFSSRPYILDLRRIEPEHFIMLGLPVAEFLALLHGRA
jgi:hypothetical protein